MTAGKLSSSLLQSRDSYGSALDNIADVYELSFESESSFAVTAVYLGNGLYQAQYVPFVAGTYTVHVKLYDEHIYGSPYEL